MLLTLASILTDATPVPVPPSQVDDDLVTPGVWGFVLTAGVAIAAVLLIFDMVRRTRRLRYRTEIRERLEAEAAAADGAVRGDAAPDAGAAPAGAAPDPGVTPPPGSSRSAGSPPSGRGTR